MTTFTILLALATLALAFEAATGFTDVYRLAIRGQSFKYSAAPAENSP